MAKYTAILEDLKYSLGYIKFIEGKKIDAINRVILATGKTWAGLELPKKIERGKYFSASYDGMQITIYKEF